MATLVATPEAAKPKALTVFRVTSGNFLEMYDFFLFGILRTADLEDLLSSRRPYASLMATFLSFAAGFAMRPIGALVLGPTSTASAAAKASFSRSRSWPAAQSSSPSCRATRQSACSRQCWWCSGGSLQGFSAGVELGGVSVYLSEMATPGNKGFYVSWQSASQQVAVVVAALIGFILGKTCCPKR